MQRGRTGLVRPFVFRNSRFAGTPPIKEGARLPQMRRPSSTAIALNAALFGSAVLGAVVTSPDANWDLRTLGLLLTFAIASDLMAASIRSAKMKVSGSFLAIVVAMVLLGGAPAALVGA